MSKKKCKHASEKILDQVVSKILTPGLIKTLLHDEEFVKETLVETAKVKNSQKEQKELGIKYNTSAEGISLVLLEVEEFFIKALGDISKE